MFSPFLYLAATIALALLPLTGLGRWRQSTVLWYGVLYVACNAGLSAMFAGGAPHASSWGFAGQIALVLGTFIGGPLLGAGLTDARRRELEQRRDWRD